MRPSDDQQLFEQAITMARRMGSLFALTVGTTSIQLIPGAPKRLALTIAPPLAGSVTISDQSPVVSGIGINVLPTGGNLILNYWEHGDWIRKPLFVIADAAGRTIGVLDCLMP